MKTHIQRLSRCYRFARANWSARER